jgi:hypothetical protein
MPETIPKDHPSFITAAQRLRRLLWGWGGLFAIMGAVTLSVLKDTTPLTAAPWFAIAITIALDSQPVYLSLVAIQLGLSILTLFPGLGTILGRDPFFVVFEASTIEALALAVVRILLLLMAWNQFMFYRILYGTEQMSGLDEDLPDIPEIIPNKSDLFARLSQYLAIGGFLLVVVAVAFRDPELTRHLAPLAFGTLTIAVGLGFGSIFSPTSRRSIAASGVLISALALITLIIAGQILLL